MSEATAVESSKAVIEVRDLTKDRESFLRKPLRVLDGLSLKVEKGMTYGLVGPNGAGKTTTIKVLLGLLRADRGSISVLGAPPGDKAALKKIGFLPEAPYFYSHLTGREFLTFSGQLFGLSGKSLNERIEQLLATVSLQKKADERTGRYSKGMLQRLGLAQALINDPELLFLDEPMSGLDPIGRMDMRRIIEDLKSRGKTVFFNSHLLPDVAALCERIGLLSGGKLVAEAAIEEVSPQRDARALEEFFLKHIKVPAEEVTP